jgi:phosphoglycerate dehydrogenase-like enzyme
VVVATIWSAASASWVKQWARPARGQDEAVRVGVLGLAELGQQVQVVAEGLQLLVSLFRQVAGLAWCSLAHDGFLSYWRWNALRVRARCWEV